MYWGKCLFYSPLASDVRLLEPDVCLRLVSEPALHLGRHHAGLRPAHPARGAVVCERLLERSCQARHGTMGLCICPASIKLIAPMRASPHLIDDRFLWLDRLRRLNPNRSRTKGAAPHKPCLLLCLLDIAQNGELPSPEFTSQRQHPITDTHSFIRQVGDKSGWLSSSSLSAKHAKLLEKPNGKRDS